MLPCAHSLWSLLQKTSTRWSWRVKPTSLPQPSDQSPVQDPTGLTSSNKIPRTLSPSLQACLPAAMNQQLKASQSNFTPELLLVMWYIHKLTRVSSLSSGPLTLHLPGSCALRALGGL